MDRVVVPEVNFTGQFARLVRVGVRPRGVLAAQGDGLPFTAEQIADYVTEGAPPVDRTGGVAEDAEVSVG